MESIPNMPESVTGSKIFADTSALVSLHLHRDSNYSAAFKLSSFIQENELVVLTSRIVIYETVSVLSEHLGILYSNEVLNNLLDSTLLIVPITEEIEQKAFELFINRTSKNVSMFDCLHFATMKSHKINTVFGFDKHFKKAGFKLLSD